ncbi:MAG TPA: FecR domain-containing protein [Polyangiaceae bacterium LLY-WYZ-15_(1-7)]|nr:hypothetical protein [Myxococcales bacterium]MAT28635.1 hypothetical protein [Sandaracinus sp.]MBJ74343.1 hypothetical protein [Sandaracinus sp.]HJL05766.1 FecR domain-containing protein [Polyangiaceae bacterium LLY-WYZ-15_(1-7)]HJL11625.1 FecR domain-containing protein [Polyangiaceae bacterium LLY-WYZ-15_(1-7)]
MTGEAMKQAVDEIGREVREGLGSPLDDPARRARQRARLVEAAGRPARGRRRPLGLALGLGALAAAAAVFVFWPTGPSMTMEGAAPRAWVAPADAPRELRFSDGSTVDVRPGARARVAHVDAETVRVQVAEGAVVSEVEPRTGATWTFEAGPYRVVVLGTKLGVRWAPREGRLEVPVWRGRVGVRGGPLDGRVWEVGAGERLVVDPEGVRLERLDEVEPSEPPRSEAAEASPAEPDEPTEVAPEPRPERRARRHPARPDWRALARAGRHAEALEALGEMAPGVLRRGGPTELLLLGDAARLGGDGALARRAYETCRERFGGHDAAAASAFRLGRLALAGGRAREAGRWLDTYLREAPDGRFAAQARGRRLEAARRSGDAAAARRAAEEYLARHPAGPYAGLARQTLAPEPSPMGSAGTGEVSGD